jgi:hypothetical protein
VTTNQLVAMLFPAIPVVLAGAAVLYFKRQDRQYQAARRAATDKYPGADPADAADLDQLNLFQRIERDIIDAKRAVDEYHDRQAQRRRQAQPQ